MSDAARIFVEGWISENIVAEPYLSENDDEERPKVFARSCISAAKRAGISQNAINEEYDDLVERMATAIGESADVEVDRLSSNGN